MEERNGDHSPSCSAEGYQQIADPVPNDDAGKENGPDCEADVSGTEVRDFAEGLFLKETWRLPAS